MHRFSILVATVMAGAVISTTPALAAETHPAAPSTSAAAIAVTAAPAAGSSAALSASVAPAVSATPGALPANWFGDYNACIWGIGLPAGVAWVFATTPATWPALARLRAPSVGAVSWYVPRVIGACGRFIRS